MTPGPRLTPSRGGEPAGADRPGEGTGFGVPANDDDGSSALPTLDAVDDRVVDAVGRASEALEYIERARGHLYAFHQLTGRADFLLEEAADGLAAAGHGDDAERLVDEIVGRNVLDGRWTFQVVEEYDDTYYEAVRDAVRALQRRHLQGLRHVHEARMKQRRRTPGAPGHEAAPGGGV